MAVRELPGLRPFTTGHGADLAGDAGADREGGTGMDAQELKRIHRVVTELQEDALRMRLAGRGEDHFYAHGMVIAYGNVLDELNYSMKLAAGE